GGGCASTVDSDMTLINCTVSGNTSNGSGGGIRASGNLYVTNSTISNNTAAFGGGISTNTYAVVTNCTVSGNAATTAGDGLQGGYGGGLYLSGASSLFSDTISGNHCALDGGGIFIAGDLIMEPANCILAGNSSETQADTVDLKGSVQSA